MTETIENKTEKDIKKVPDNSKGFVNLIIPICCREGWDSCPHVVKKVRQKKQNVGL